MTPRLDNSSLGRWVDRTSRMVGYRDEALDFLERAGRQLPVFESDIGLVCRLWSVADEHDELVCRASRSSTPLCSSPPGNWISPGGGDKNDLG